jgi:hypothetical protein
LINLKCFFGHDWVEKDKKPLHIFANDKARRPSAIYTRYLYQCAKCKKRKTHSVDGDWCDGPDEDDGDDIPPTLSPDDYFDLITKEK